MSTGLIEKIEFYAEQSKYLFRVHYDCREIKNIHSLQTVHRFVTSIDSAWDAIHADPAISAIELSEFYDDSSLYFITCSLTRGGQLSRLANNNREVLYLKFKRSHSLDEICNQPFNWRSVLATKEKQRQHNIAGSALRKRKLIEDLVLLVRLYL